MISRDFTGGYGPEEYLIRKAIPGEYIFRVKVFSPLVQTQTGGVTVFVTITLNAGRSNAEEKYIVVRLTKPKEVVEVAKVIFV